MLKSDFVDVYQIDCIIRKNKKITLFVQKELCNWLYEFAPTHFISIQFPTNQRSTMMEISRNYLRTVMKYFQKQLSPRHWIRKPLLFIGFAEKNKVDKGKIHFHIFLQNNRYTDEKIITAMNKTIKHFKFSSDVINTQQINRTPYCSYIYGTKEIKANKKAHFDDSRIILSTEMFVKRTEYSKLSHKPFVVGPKTSKIITYKPDEKGATTRQIWVKCKK